MITDSGSVANLGIKLGRGSYGAVFEGEFLFPYNMKNPRREINIASQCRHPNLLKFICAPKNEKETCLLIVTELMDTGLQTFLGQRPSQICELEPQEIKSISLDVAIGLNYLH